MSAQAERIAELERRVASDSRNTSKPPSSDRLRRNLGASRCDSGRAAGPSRLREIRAEHWSRWPIRTWYSIAILTPAPTAGPDSSVDDVRAVEPGRSSTRDLLEGLAPLRGRRAARPPPTSLR
ncbi:DUF6444 domain-containing protein [Streptomyces sp. NPDC059861]|uniref:DUF6444 domain-containing protein n=1 Tax=Streptomyces sp. NPDC059861 TaxID=3346974 RepID=UPI0036514F4A